jgi:predicted PurR-regulated permease PerM
MKLIERHEWMRRILGQTRRPEEMMPEKSRCLKQSRRDISTTVGALARLIIAVVVGLFLVANPSTYIDGAVRFVPPSKRPRTKEILHEIGCTLRAWLLGKAVTVIGILAFTGLWLIGAELVLVLGIIAALFSLIPTIGPIHAVIPASLMALIGGSDKVLYVVLLYSAIESFESYVLTPLLQQHMVVLPPALTISMQFLFGVLAGGAERPAREPDDSRVHGHHRHGLHRGHSGRQMIAQEPCLAPAGTALHGVRTFVRNVR